MYSDTFEQNPRATLSFASKEATKPELEAQLFHCDTSEMIDLSWQTTDFCDCFTYGIDVRYFGLYLNKHMPILDQSDQNCTRTSYSALHLDMIYQSLQAFCHQFSMSLPKKSFLLMLSH